MEISDQLRCVFSADVEQQDNSYLIEVPEQEIRLGDLQQGEAYRVAVLPCPSNEEANDIDTDTDTKAEPERERGRSKPPVEEGEERSVEIEDIGEQGDGITRVERGFVLIVPDTEQGERVVVEIADVRENVAFAEVVERVSYYE
ncbi:TRAM domain-containing protein [Haloarcula marina]|uniref:TRAM domain-containing protein n=1 Tax=Haloarcula marina TaxID=2961574 RepID=UPI0020B8DC33|nr:TRAM domain-containing protein [Halomicroarcula marina]